MEPRTELVSTFQDEVGPQHLNLLTYEDGGGDIFDSPRKQTNESRRTD